MTTTTSNPTNHWDGTSPDGWTVDEVGTKILEAQRRFDSEYLECARQLAGCLFGERGAGSIESMAASLDEYLTRTRKQGYPAGLSAWLDALESGAVPDSFEGPYARVDDGIDSLWEQRPKRLRTRDA